MKSSSFGNQPIGELCTIPNIDILSVTIPFDLKNKHKGCRFNIEYRVKEDTSPARLQASSPMVRKLKSKEENGYV